MFEQALNGCMVPAPPSVFVLFAVPFLLSVYMLIVTNFRAGFAHVCFPGGSFSSASN